MTNNLHHLKAGIKTVFLSLGLGYHHIQIIGLEFLQRCGHQIRVNTWTGSYSISTQFQVWETGTHKNTLIWKFVTQGVGVRLKLIPQPWSFLNNAQIICFMMMDFLIKSFPISSMWNIGWIKEGFYRVLASSAVWRGRGQGKSLNLSRYIRERKIYTLY